MLPVTPIILLATLASPLPVGGHLLELQPEPASIFPQSLRRPVVVDCGPEPADADCRVDAAIDLLGDGDDFMHASVVLTADSDYWLAEPTDSSAAEWADDASSVFLGRKWDLEVLNAVPAGAEEDGVHFVPYRLRLFVSFGESGRPKSAWAHPLEVHAADAAVHGLGYRVYLFDADLSGRWGDAGDAWVAVPDETELDPDDVVAVGDCSQGLGLEVLDDEGLRALLSEGCAPTRRETPRFFKPTGP